MKNKKAILWIIAIAIVVIIVIAVSGGKDDGNVSSRNETEKISQNKEWVELMKLTGTGDKKSDIFFYEGGKARLRYNLQGSDWSAFIAYVVKEGVDIMVDGGFPEITLDSPEEGESSLSHLKRGNYYLNIISANGKWEVVVEEWK